MINLSIFSERLSYLMFENNNMTGKLLAQEIGIAAPTVTRYLNEKHTPTVKNLILIADYFNRSVDYLLGFEDENSNLTFKPCPPFPEQLKFLKKHFNVTQQTLYKSANVSESSFFEWKNGSSYPTLNSIIKLAEKFDVRIDFILGRES